MLGWLSAIGSILGAVGKAISAGLALLARRDNIELGQSRQKEVQQKQADVATKAMQEAQAGPRGRDVTQKGLEDGSF